MDTCVKTARLLVVLFVTAILGKGFILDNVAQAEAVWQQPLLSSQKQANTTQRKIDRLDDENQQNLQRYWAVRDEIRQVEKQLEERHKLLERQAQQLADIQRQQGELQKVDAVFYPLLTEMTDVYTKLVAAEPHLLPQERLARSKVLQQNLTNTNMSLDEQYRSLLAAYQIEGNYNQMLLSWLGEVESESQARAVQFLAVGRIALYYLTLDGKQGAVWSGSIWKKLTNKQCQQVKLAIDIALHNQSEQVIALPLLKGVVR